MRQRPHARRAGRPPRRQVVSGDGMVADPNGAAAARQSGVPSSRDAGNPAAGDLTDLYHEVCEHIRATDDTSLKLLAAVPLATGIGITLLVRPSTPDLADGPRSLLSLFAAVVTFAIYRWERKNIATCGHYRDWAAALERDHFKLPIPADEGLAPRTHPHGRVTAPAFAGQSWGKTQAEMLLYWTVIVSWLAASAYTLIR
jgi:hypothetical protein